jgi:hypothetical protein
VNLDLRGASVRARSARLLGDAEVKLLAPAGTDTLEFRFVSQEVRGADRDQVRGPAFNDVEATLALAPRKLSQSIGIVGASARLGAGEIPALAWFEPWLDGKSSRPRLGGSARLAFHVERHRDRSVKGVLSTTARAASVRVPSLELRSNAALETEFARAANDELFRATADVSMDGLVIASGDGRSEAMVASFRTKDLRIDSSAATVNAHVSVDARPIRGVLPLVVGFGPLRSIITGALGLENLEATVKLDLGPRAQRLALVGAKSGGLRARGRAESVAGGPWNGRFLLSTLVANMGIRIDAGEVGVDPFVSDEWLQAGPSATKPSIPRPRAATRLTLSDDRGPRVSPRAAENRQPGRVPRRPSSHAP